MKEWSEELGVSYTYFKQVVNEEGFESARKLSISKSGIESIMEDLLKSLYNKEILYDTRDLKKYRPDFLLPEEKLIIECDGLFWHCDKIKNDRFYHKNKKEFYINKGYKSLFFRDNEIKEKLPIVKSIISNNLKLNKKRYFARNLLIKTIEKQKAKEFFNQNHLMGTGSGRTYALCYEDNIVCAMQVRWKNKKDKLLEISRFCSMLETSVVGGFSRILKNIIKKENPNSIITFIDERYGSGNYLTSLGFIKNKTYISFNWTDGKIVLHRMRFKKNQGYEKGFYKIWDCGQTSFIKEINE